MDPIFGTGVNAGPPGTPCSKCKDSKIISTGYHGPPGDDRGHLPCPVCQEEAFHACLLRGDFMYGVSISDSFNAIREVKGESPVDLSVPSASDAQSSSEPESIGDVIESEQAKEARERVERREE